MINELLINLLFALVPIALFAIGVAWGLKRKDSDKSRIIKGKTDESKKTRQKSIDLFKEASKTNNKAQSLAETLDIGHSDIDDKYLNDAKQLASPITIQQVIEKCDRDEAFLTEWDTALQEEVKEREELAIEEATRNAPFQYQPNGNGLSRNMGAAVLVLAVLLGGCEQPVSSFTNETLAIDVTGSYASGGPVSITDPLSLRSSSEISFHKHKTKLTVINDRRVQEHFSDSIDFPEDFLDRKDKERIEEQKAYPIRLEQRWKQFSEGLDKNLGESYIFPAIKINCNDLARSGADTRILHLYSDMLPSSPAFDVGDFVRSPKAIFKDGMAEKIIEKIDDHFYEHPYEDWTGIKIIVHYNPPKAKDELFAACMELMKIWVESHGAKIFSQTF